MQLGRKNLVYSLALACLILLFLVGYFIYMLPSLYVDYMMEQNLKSIREQHNAYVKSGTYEGVQVKNAAACLSVRLPYDGNSLFITGKAFSAEIVVKDERLGSLIDQFREKIKSTQSMDSGMDLKDTDAKSLNKELDSFKETLEDILNNEVSLPVEIRFLYIQDMEEEYTNETVKYHIYSDAMMIMEAGVEDSGNKYTNYIAIEQTGDSLILSMLPVVTPEIDEIRPVVLQSLPMLGAVILFVVLLFSQVYSRGIVAPIVELVQHAGQMKCTEDFSVPPLSDQWEKREDEVRELADTLDDFYKQIKESYTKLEEKNRELEEENKRQGIFLRASSHQLKTPVAAALLLVDGMINEIGKYRDAKTYLPKVKEQLLSMRKMVEDILYLNHCADHILFQNLEIENLLREKLHSYQVAAAEKQLVIDTSFEKGMEVCTDEMMISQILDNLLSNAVKYTPQKGRIQITIHSGDAAEKSSGREKRVCEIQIENFGAAIPDELLPHIFEPFVSGSHDADAAGVHSHGLGLYIASYYAGKLGISITVRNGENSVITTVFFPESFIRTSYEIHKELIE